MIKSLSRAEISYIIIISSGIISLIIASLISSSIALHFMENQSNFSSYLQSKVNIINAEAMISLSFSLLAMLFLFLQSKTRLHYLYSLIAGIIRLILFISILIIYWKPGWYYILDPAGSLKSAYVIIISSGFQIICFFTAIKIKKK